MDPHGQAALVTGAASGLGAETAVRLAQAGAKVALLDVNSAAAAALAGRIDGLALRCDVTDAEAAAAALAAARVEPTLVVPQPTLRTRSASKASAAR